MNLLFFTIEVEHGAEHDARGERAPGVLARRRRLLRPIGLAILVVLCAIAAGCGGWVLAGGGPTDVEVPGWLPFLTPAVAAEGDVQARLEVISRPAGATVMLDGHPRGSSPLVLSVADGGHTLVLKHPDAIDEQRQVTVAGDTTVDVSMWLRRPAAMLLKPAYPGATIADVTFLEDGRLALSMSVPGGLVNTADRSLREPWIFDPTDGHLAPFTAGGSSLQAAKVAVSPDGHLLAYIQRSLTVPMAGGATPRLTDVWVAHADRTAPPVRVLALPAGSASTATGSTPSGEIEEIRDLTWAPDGRQLLVTVRLAEVVGGYLPAPRSRLLRLDASSDQLTPPVELMTLPAEVVGSSYTWAPDGNWVAFLTQTNGSDGTSFVALCAVDTSAGGAVAGFRYIADLGHPADPAGALPVAAAAWSPMGDGRLVYAAATPKITVSNPLGLPVTAGGEPGLFVATAGGQGLTAEYGQRLGSGTGLIAPIWSSTKELDGAGLIALARSDRGSKPLVIRGIDAVSGTPDNVDIVLPAAVGGSGIAAARWDLTHGRLLVLARHDNSSSGLLDYWLVQLEAQGQEG